MCSVILVSVALTVRFCRRPTRKLVTVPAVKREQVSDVDLWPVPRRSKEKASARLESPVVVVSSDEGSDQISDTPKAKGRPARALKNERYLLHAYSCLRYG